MKIWLPLTPIITIYTLAFLYKLSKGQSIIWKKATGDKITITLIGTFVFCCASFLWFDPNIMKSKGSGYVYLYTTGRLLAVILVGMSVGAVYRTLYIDHYQQTINEMKVFGKATYLLFFITAALSGSYGFFTHTSWGLFEIKYISDTFMWLVELGWFISGIIGFWVYFRHIRYWEDNQQKIINKSPPNIL